MSGETSLIIVSQRALVSLELELGLHRISGRHDIRFRLPDIRPDILPEKLYMVYPFFSQFSIWCNPSFLFACFFCVIQFLHTFSLFDYLVGRREKDIYTYFHISFLHYSSCVKIDKTLNGFFTKIKLL